MSKKPDWHVQLDKAAQAFTDAILAMTDDELFALKFADQHVTNSNCWFVSYNIAPMASDLAANELMLRAQAIEAAKLARRETGSTEGESAVPEEGCAQDTTS